MRLSFLKYKTRGFLKNNNAVRTSLPYKQANSVGILFTTADKRKHDEVKEFIKRLEQDGKHVKVITFLPKNTDNFEFLFDFFTDKDVTFWGNITSENATRFTQLPFDFLFYLDTEPNPMLMNLIARSKARCRVGAYGEGVQRYFELMIESKGALKPLLDGMYRYTSALR